jgi:hypothetical protein
MLFTFSYFLSVLTLMKEFDSSYLKCLLTVFYLFAVKAAFDGVRLPEVDALWGQTKRKIALCGCELLCEK